ncbi:MAG TPA: beta-propeller fold lactonase family protein [Vicinamibacterales bacterium]|nr:beta-propeller fold lactonase family protein [Vicinamibacterales bacterium]
MRVGRSLTPVVVALLAAAAWLAAVRAAPPPSDEYFVYVGSYTDPPSNSKGIYGWRFSPASGRVAPLGLVAQTVNPAYVHATPDGKFLFATNWQTPDAAKADTVSAYAIDATLGRLTLLNTASAGGGLPNQVVVDPRGIIAAVTNYGFRTTDPDRNNSSFAALKIRPDGTLDDPMYVDHYTGPAASPRQTTGAHTHGVVFTKDDRFAFVAELGLDRIYTYRVDPTMPALVPSTPPFVKVSAGSGPRRLALSPTDRFLYVNHETDSKVSVFSVENGRLTEIQQISTLPTEFTGRNTTAEIQIDKSGRFLYVSNRGADTVTMFAVDPTKGTLRLHEFFAARGRTPRNITIDPTGRYLFVSNQGSNNVVVFAIDGATGRLTPTGTELKIDQPASVFFVKAAAPAPRQITWTFDRMETIGGVKTTVEGHPRIIESPTGKAVEFDGVGDSLLIEQHPLAGAETFTFEAIFRPDGGANQQRWFHLAEIDQKTGLATSVEKTTSESNSRFLFEIRVVNENEWYLDAFINGPGYSKALMVPDKRHPLGRWYHVAQVYDGKWYRSYVNGELQGEAEVAFTPQGAGRASVGVRMNKVNYFHGAVAKARFTSAALPVSEFMTIAGK